MANPLRALLSIFFSCYISARRFFSVLWIKLNRCISEPDMLMRTSPGKPRGYHKGVVIGDGIAMGLGDLGVVFGAGAGVAALLVPIAQVENSIRRRWKMANRGEYNSTTFDWLPPAVGENGGPSTGTRQNKQSGRLYERTFGKGSAFHDADIVVVMMGTSDVLRKLDGMPIQAMSRDPWTLYEEREFATVVLNIHAIATHLQSQGKRVCVVDMPSTDIPNASLGKMRRLNQQIKQKITKDPVLSCKDEKLAKEKGFHPVQYVSLGNNHRIMRSEFRSYDSVHLNRKGYKLLALDMFDKIRPMMINTEWQVWKPQLISTCEDITNTQNGMEVKKQQ